MTTDMQKYNLSALQCICICFAYTNETSEGLNTKTTHNML